MLHYIIGTAGTGKTQYARTLSVKLSSDKQSDVILLVPEQYSFETERSLISIGARYPDAKLEVRDFSSLAKDIFKNYGGIPGQNITNGMKAVAMAMSIQKCRNDSTYLEKIYSPSTVAPLFLSLYSEFKQSGTDIDKLDSVITKLTGSLKEKMKALDSVFAMYEQIVERKFSDNERLLEKLIKKKETPEYFKDKTIILDGFRTFSGEQLRLLEIIISYSKDTYITLCTDSLDLESGSEIFNNIKRTSRILSEYARENSIKIATPIKLTENFRNRNSNIDALGQIICGYPENFSNDDCSLSIKCASSPHKEVEYVATSIRKLIYENPELRYKDIAVISRSIKDYSNIVSSSFKKYAIPFHIDWRRPLKNEPIAVLITSALGACENNFNTDEIFAALKSGVVDISSNEVSLLENYTYIWKTAGIDLRKELTFNPNGTGRSLSPDEENELFKLNEIRKNAISPFARLYNSLSENTNGSKIIGSIYEFIKEIGADKKTAELNKTALADGRQNDADAAIHSYNLIIDILSGMHELLSEEPVDLSYIYSLFTAAVESSDMGQLPQGLDEIMIGSADRIRPGSPKIIFILGANDGKFPYIPLSSGILNDNERKQICDLGVDIVENNEDTIHDEEFLFYNSISIPIDRLFISYNTTDNARPNEIISKIEETCIKDSPSDVFEHSWSIIGAAEDISSLVNTNTNNVSTNAANILLNNDVLPKNIVNAIQSSNHIQDEKLTSETALKLFGTDLVMHPTDIDTFGKCPFRYFCQFGLKIKPKMQIDFDSRMKGSIMHYVMETLLNPKNNYDFSSQGYINNTPIIDIISNLVDEYVKKDIGDWNKPLLFNYKINTIKKDSVTIIERFIRELNAGKFKVLEVEKKIGNGPNDITPRSLTLEDMHKISLQGKVDRIDEYIDEFGNLYIRVIDYKSSKKKLSEEDIKHGIGTQMLVYLFTISEYFNNNGNKATPSAVLYALLRDDVNSTSESAEDDEIIESSDKDGKFRGFIRENESVINALGGEENKLLNITFKKDGTSSKNSDVVSEQYFDSLSEIVDNALISMGNRLHQGDISSTVTDSYCHGNGCEWCEYKCICSHAGTADHMQTKESTEGKNVDE